MKTIALLTSFVAMLFVLNGCSSYCQKPCSSTQSTAPCYHHDLKGESM